LAFRTDRKLIRESKKDPRLTAAEVADAANVSELSVRSVRRRLSKAGLNGRVAAKKPFVSKKNMAKRLEFARKHLNWTIADWKKVLWSDESKLNLINSDGIRYVRRPPSTHFDPKYTVGTVKHGGGNIMVWGSFSFLGLGPLHRIEGIMDQYQYRDILEKIMLPWAKRKMPRGWVFQQDNDPKHTAKSVKKWFDTKKVKVLEWPAQSPDLNPIENLWGKVKQGLRGQKFKKPDDLFNALSHQWSQIPNTYLEKLVESMPSRCKAVVNTKGAPTKY
jgi:hypothetical protein